MLSKVAWIRCFLLLVPGGALPAQNRASSRELGGTWIQRESVSVVPQRAFKVSSLHELLFGHTYRQLWIHPLRLGVADLSRIGGGIEAVKRGDHNSSRPFRFQATDGHVFGYRQLVKDATLDWPERQQTATLRKLAKDQISSTVPGGVLAVAVIERAAGVISEQSELVVLPDDERLKEWRRDFAGIPGIIEHRLGDAEIDLALVPGAREFLDSDSLFARLRQDGTSWVDARAYLTARLVDLLVGDWDRHAGQWTWARFDEQGGHRWAPIPSDRDWAFNRLDGLVWSLVRWVQPKFQHFDPHFTNLPGMLLMSQGLDRRLLVELDRPAWDSVVQRFVSRVTDRVIASAVAELPRDFDATTLAWLREALARRREELPAVAAEFYRQLAAEVEVWGSDGADRFELTAAREDLVLRVKRAGSRRSWSRRFVSNETREARVYALAGADTLIGNAAGTPIRIRFVDERGGPLALVGQLRGVRVYDSTLSFKPPVKAYVPEVMFRDWGSGFGVAPWIDYRWETGFILGGGAVLTRYGFRRVPFASRLTLRAAVAPGTGGINAELSEDMRFERPELGLSLRASMRSAEVIGYFGQGNATERTEADEFYAVRRRDYRVEPKLILRQGPLTWSIGAIGEVSQIDLDRPTLLSNEDPYGSGDFTELGANASGELDLRNDQAYPKFGVRARVSGRMFPALADVNSAFSVLSGEVSGFATATFLPAKPTLALRAGGARGWGKLPFFEQPALGAVETIRGLPPRRFSGDGTVYGSAELRLDLGGFKLLLPGDWGVYGVGDVGRVYLEGETSRRWHRGWGAGLWFALFDRKTTLTFTYARSEGSERVYLHHGFHF